MVDWISAEGVDCKEDGGERGDSKADLDHRKGTGGGFGVAEPPPPLHFPSSSVNVVGRQGLSLLSHYVNKFHMHHS